jgi:aminomethyltransferase
MTDGQLKSLPLEDLHKSAGARFGGFAGWSMPLTYPAGVMKEHLHVRDHAGMFDISHMKLIELSGPGAIALLDRACPLDAAALELSQSKYTFLLDDNAGILDDLIVTRLDQHRFMVVANAGNAAADEAHLKALARGFEVSVTPLDRVFLALQGPETADALLKIGIETEALTFMHGLELRHDWFMTRSGYTGEDGFEIALPEADARQLVAELTADPRVMWIGLAARDSLRLEAGLCLHGQDITTATDPASAGLMWAIPKDVRAHGAFVGADALRRILADGAAEKRVGLRPEGRLPVRAGTQLSDADGNPSGRVTSGGFGPSAETPVAMGYVTAALALSGTKLFADVRGTKVPVEISSLPFIQHRYRKG